MRKCLLFLIPCFLMVACAKPVAIVTNFHALDNAVEHLRLYVMANQNKLDKEDLAVLEECYNHWLGIKDTLSRLGCDMDLTGTICRLDLNTVKILHETAKTDYERAYKIGEKVYPKLDTQGRIILNQFKTAWENLDSVLTDFENDPNADKTSEVIQALSVFASITAKTLPVILTSSM